MALVFKVFNMYNFIFMLNYLYNQEEWLSPIAAVHVIQPVHTDVVLAARFHSLSVLIAMAFFLFTTNFFLY